MNTLKNTVSLIGNLGQDPEMTNLGADNAMARFSIATNESFKDKKGEWVSNTTWHKVVAWGKGAELCEQLLKKGSEIVIEGKLVNDSYTDKEGIKRFKTEIKMREFMLLNRERKTNETTTKSA